MRWSETNGAATEVVLSVMGLKSSSLLMLSALLHTIFSSIK